MRLTNLDGRLRDRGLTVVTHGNWLERGSLVFHPRGVVCHHTGPWSTVQGMVDLCINGRPDLPGPLCQVVLAPDGICHLVAGGRANHAGAGGWRNLTGNSMVVGIEAIHSGAEGVRWPDAQYQAFVRCSAAICELLGVSADMVAAHREWAPRRKTDPVGLDMDRFRHEVAVLLDLWRAPVPLAPKVVSPPSSRIISEAEGMRITTHFFDIPGLDDQGRGWVDIPFPLEEIVEVVAQGSSPPEDGYWAPVVVTLQPRGGATRLTLAGAPGQRTGVFWKRLERE